MTANDSREPVKYTPPHERTSGNFDDYELDDAGRHIEMADKIKSNPHMMKALAEHHAKKAAKHKKLAESMKPHMKRGLVSEKALEKASHKNHV